jgi:hypothetical protein
MRSSIVGGVIVALLGLTVAPGAPSGAHAQDTDTFHGLTPARLVDTRPGGTTVDGQLEGVGRVEGSSTFALTVVGRGGVPATGVGAVALNVTVADALATSYLTVYPTGQPRPTASNLNFGNLGTRANSVLVDVGADGQVSFYNGAAAFPNRPTGVHLIVDVVGWFPTGSTFHGLAPARLLDTRAGAATIDGSFSGPGPLAPHTSRDIVLAGRGDVPADAGSVALNLTAVDPTGAGYVTAWPTGQPRPTASNLNFTAGMNVPNMVVVPVGDDGSVSLYNGSDGATNLILDVLGWFPSDSGFTGMNPGRIMDTRLGGSTVDARFAGGDLVDRGVPINLVVGGRADVPATAGSALLNVTVVEPTDRGYLTAYPLGAPQPNASNLNFFAGQTVANMVVAPLGRDGQIKLFIGGAPTFEAGRDDYGAHVVVDVLGWFAGDPAVPAGPGEPVFTAAGLASTTFGTPVSTALAELEAVTGPIVEVDVRTFPVNTAPGVYADPTLIAEFAHPHYLESCGALTCLVFGGPSPDDLAFVGWTSTDSAYLDAAGVGVGSRLSEFAAAFASVTDRGCGRIDVETVSGVSGSAPTDVGIHSALSAMFAGTLIQYADADEYC